MDDQENTKPSTAFSDLVHAIRQRPRHLAAVVVHLNDTYLLEEHPDQRLPGFSRLIATVERLRQIVGQASGTARVVVVHSGDFLGPSRVGRVDKGKAMVEVLNRLGLDYFVLGNHEVDYGDHNLVERFSELRAQLLVGNTMVHPDVAYEPTHLWPSPDDPLIAFTGVISRDVWEAIRWWPFDDPAEFLTSFAKETRNVPFHIVLSHALRREDRELRSPLGALRRVAVLGGHDHHIDWPEFDGPAPLYKNLSNLKTVRVFLLQLGGYTAINRLGIGYRMLREELDRDLTGSDGDLDRLFAHLHPADAAVLRRCLRDPKDEEGEAVGLRAFVDEDEEETVPPAAFVRRLAALPYVNDIHSFKLIFDDFVAASADEKDWLTARLPAIPTGTSTVVRDFSHEASALDATDSALRQGDTDFGLFVADCVRRKAGAEVALINSGSFRCDMKLPALIHEGHLRDTFIYDDFDSTKKDKSAVIVLRLPSNLVTDLIAFGRRQRGSGDFPQVSDDRLSNAKDVTVAVSGYLLLDPKSTGYPGVLARYWGVSETEARARIAASIAARHTIIGSVLECAAQVVYRDPPSSLPEDPADRFVVLARLVSIAFGSRLGASIPDGVQWNNAFAAAVGTDEPSADSGFNDARQELRRFITDFRRQFLKDLRDKPQAAISLWDLQDQLRFHEASVREGIVYDRILEHATKGLFPWRGRYWHR